MTDAQKPEVKVEEVKLPEEVKQPVVPSTPKVEEAQVVNTDEGSVVVDEVKETVAETPEPTLPKAEETVSVETPKPVVEEELNLSTSEEDKGMAVRADETGDKVYWVKDGKRYWVRNPETLKKLGFNLGGEKRILFNELLKYPEGEPVDLTTPGMTVEKATEVVEKPAIPEPNEPHKIWS